MVADKVESTYRRWISKVDSSQPKSDDIARLHELAYQIYLAKQSGDKKWLNINSGQWLADLLTKDGRFTNHQINRLSYMLSDIVNYNFWLVERNSEA